MNKKKNIASPNAFLIGFPFMLFFVFAGIGGGLWALDRILLERILYSDGKLISGVVLQKIESNTKGDNAVHKRVHYIKYRFKVNNRSIVNEARVEGEHFTRLKPGGSIGIRYLPDEPDKSLPDGSHLSRLFILFVIFGFIVGLGASVVAIGMLVDKFKKK